MRVGIPRALMYYEFYPLWRTFLERLGHQVVMSCRTNKAVLEKGTALAVDEACLPVKLALGHVENLVGRCDAIFLPRLLTIEDNGFLCPKLVGLPDMVRALPISCPPLVAPTVDVNTDPDLVNPFLLAARELGMSSSKGRAAYKDAAAVQARVMESVRAGRPLGLALDDFEKGKILAPGDAELSRPRPKVGKGGHRNLRIALLGHPYNIHDPYLSMDVADKLMSLGCEVIPTEVIPPDIYKGALEELGHNVYWIFGRRVIGPVLHFMKAGSVDGIVYVVSFGCGPDALLKGIADVLAKKRPDLPYMSVVLDEHSADGGLVTRLEAFVDMARRAQARRGPEILSREKSGPTEPDASPGLRARNGAIHPKEPDLRAGRPAPEDGAPRPGRDAPTTRPPEARSHAISFPHIGTLHIPLRGMIESLGLNCLVPPPSTRRTLDIGARHSPELACLPFKLSLGNYVEALDAGATHILGLSSRFGASCRLYFFPAAQVEILRDMGYDFEMIALDSGRRDSGGEIAKTAKTRAGKSKWQFAKAFVWVFMRKLLACEKAEHLALDARAHAVRPKEVSAVLRRALAAIDRCEPGRLRYLMRSVKDEFRSIERDPDRRPLRIGVVGELFVLLDSFSNHRIEEKLGEMGIYVKRNFWASKKILRTICRWLDPEYVGAMKAATRYLGIDIGAECNVTVGDVIEYKRHGYDGLVHLMPFSCMPEIVAESVLPLARRDSQMPVITFALDEQTSTAGMRTRLEAFVDLLSRQRKSRLQACRA